MFLSLHNAAGISSVSSPTSSIVRTPNTIHVPFRPISTKEKPSPPVSLLAQVDQEEYILLPNASALVPICSSNLNQAEEHQIRIVAPMTDEHGQGVVEFEGLWISKGGKLLRVEGSLLGEEYESEDSFDAENEQVGEKHRIGLSELSKNTHHTENRSEVEHKDAFGSANQPRRRKKVIEIVTDSPGSFGGKHKSARTGGADGLLAGVMGWEYLIGDMFGADHIGIGVEGMCLTQECIGGIGSPAGIGEVFFRR